MGVASFDALTADYLKTVIGKKWSTFDGCTGAFVAEMDFGTSPAIKAELNKIVDEGFFGYTPDFVVEDMQRSCAAWYADRYGWDVPAEWVRPVPDVITGFLAAMEHYRKPGTTKVIVPTPAYMPFVSLPQKLVNLDVIEVPMLVVDGRWEMDFDAIDTAFADGGGLLVLCNPHNPIGRVWSRDELVKLSEIVEKHQGRVFSDEIHGPLVYPGLTHIPYASISEAAANHTVTCTSASKAWNLAGLKAAQMIFSNEADFTAWKNDHWWAEHGASTFGIAANAAAYRVGGEWLDEVLAYLDGNRKRMAELLAEHMPEVKYIMPEGTYLAWLDFRETGVGEDVDVFFREHAKVAITNGAACGEVGKQHVRFNLAMSRPMLEETVQKMAAAVNEFVPVY
ncbi:MAG: aminotransferase class I/II-fold pyridoxal phosphate-dependent enzyme [Thermomicrobiales bacterium]|nr:aminotransferase class I/II-fold pyridoxal phosphate-dependent enzyme [Thermomicrobiales bacterium]